MDKDNETDVLKLRDEWYSEAKNVKSIDELNAFNKKLFVDYVRDNGKHDYNTMCYATAAFATAAICMCERFFGMSGFQMSCVAWDVARNITLMDDSCGVKLLEYYKMLYPQYGYRFEKVISEDVWNALQKEAKARLERDGHLMHDDVRRHMESIANGVIPFGYSISND